jgi:hypothetical protein
MITPEMFTREIVKLQEQFGNNKFSQRKSELIYQVVRKLKLEDLTGIIDGFIGNAKFAPNLEDFQNAARKYRSNDPNRPKVQCSTCRSSGVVIVRKKTGEIGEYAFQCACENGNEYKAFPMWKDYYQKEFTRQQIPIELTRKFYKHKSEEK